MTINERIIEIEGQRGILQIVRILHENGEMLYGTLYNNPNHIKISNNSTAKRALNILIKNKLVRQRCPAGRKAIFYCLTEKGKRFAKCIYEMEKILDE